RISSSGRFVLFMTTATNVVAGFTNHAQHLLVRDLWAGRTLDPLGVYAFATPAFNQARFVISENERYIFFLSTGNYDPKVANTNAQIHLFRTPLFAPRLRWQGPHLRGNGLAGRGYVLEA